MRRMWRVRKFRDDHRPRRGLVVRPSQHLESSSSSYSGFLYQWTGAVDQEVLEKSKGALGITSIEGKAPKHNVGCASLDASSKPCLEVIEKAARN
jgi:hypothetical protein